MHSLTPEYLAALRFDGTQAATLRSLACTIWLTALYESVANQLAKKPKISAKAMA